LKRQAYPDAFRNNEAAPVEMLPKYA